MNAKASNSLFLLPVGWILKFLPLFFFTFPLVPLRAQIIPNKTQVLIKLSPRPAEKTERDRDAFFDQQAVLRVIAQSSKEAVTNAQIHFFFIYDDVQASGKIKRKVHEDTVNATFAKEELRAFDSREFRLTGKINKAGQLIGMKHIGHAVIIVENKSQIFHQFLPKEIQKAVNEVMPPDEEDAAPSASSPKESIKPSESPDKVVGQDEDDLVVYGYKFTAEEADKILTIVNEMTEEELVTKVGLSKRGAHELTRNRPFRQLKDIPKTPYVKKQAIESLKLHLMKK